MTDNEQQELLFKVTDAIKTLDYNDLQKLYSFLIKLENGLSKIQNKEG